jgi:hypothetical protein
VKKILAPLSVLQLFTALTQADVAYSGEAFEDQATGTLPITANGTDYVLTSTSGDKAEVAGNIAAGPTGQHGLVRGDANKHMTLTNPMSLASDRVTSLEISLAVYFNNVGNNNRLNLVYSASGDFTDQVSIQVFNPTGTADLPNFEYEEDQWYLGQSVTIDSADVIFTDTAKIRWAKIGTGQSNRVYFDDVIITGIGGAGAPAFAITAIDYSPSDDMLTLTWRSRPDEIYAVKFSGDMSGWGADLDDSIPADMGDTTTKTFDLNEGFLNGANLADATRVYFRVEKLANE